MIHVVQRALIYRSRITGGVLLAHPEEDSKEDTKKFDKNIDYNDISI